MAALFFDRNAQEFCPTGISIESNQCFIGIRDGFSGPIENLFPYIISSLLLLFFVSDRLKRNAVIAILTISVPLLYFIFAVVPADCGSILCSRIDTSLLARPIYPIVTILTLIISAIYFYFKDKRPPKESKVKKYISDLWRGL